MLLSGYSYLNRAMNSIVEEQQQQKIDLLTLKSNFTGFSSSPSQSEHNLYLQVFSLIPFEEVSRKLRSQTQNLKPRKSGKRRPRTLRPKNTDPPNLDVVDKTVPLKG